MSNKETNVTGDENAPNTQQGDNVVADSSCCSVVEQSSCCEQSEKASCCSSDDAPGSCGCK